MWLKVAWQIYFRVFMSTLLSYFGFSIAYTLLNFITTLFMMVQWSFYEYEFRDIWLNQSDKAFYHFALL